MRGSVKGEREEWSIDPGGGRRVSPAETTLPDWKRRPRKAIQPARGGRRTPQFLPEAFDLTPISPTLSARPRPRAPTCPTLGQLPTPEDPMRIRIEYCTQ